MLADEPLDGVAREWPCDPGGEQRAVRAGVALGEPGSEHLDGLAGQRCCPVFATFAVAADVRSGAQVGVLVGEGGELGYPQAGLDGE